MGAARLHVAWGDAALLETQAARARLEESLGDEERARLAAIASPARRVQFIAARWLVRTVLAEVQGREPLDWVLSAGGDGPPRVLHGTGSRLHLALSHSANCVACAVGSEAIGLDVEAPRRPRDVLALAEIACDEAEQAMLRAQPAEAREALFYELWTAKEAWIKRLAQPMAPRRMARIHLRPALLSDAAPVRVWSLQTATLAVAASARLAIQWHGRAPAARGAWIVNDEGERG